jgi:hypothetical protein
LEISAKKRQEKELARNIQVLIHSLYFALPCACIIVHPALLITCRVCDNICAPCGRRDVVGALLLVGRVGGKRGEKERGHAISKRHVPLEWIVIVCGYTAATVHGIYFFGTVKYQFL